MTPHPRTPGWTVRPTPESERRGNMYLADVMASSDAGPFFVARCAYTIKADLIVRAVNAEPRLVEALRALRASLLPNDMDPQECIDLIDHVDALLAEYGEKGETV